MTYDIMIVVLVLVLGFIICSGLFWIIVIRLESRLIKYIDREDELAVEKLSVTLKEQMKEDRHTLRGELSKELAAVHRELSLLRQQERILTSWMDRAKGAIVDGKN